MSIGIKIYMPQCTNIDKVAALDYMKFNPEATQEDAFSFARCKNESVVGEIRCTDCGGGDFLYFFYRDMQPDEQQYFKALMDNMRERFGIDEKNLYDMHLTAAAARELVMTHNADDRLMRHIKNAVYIGRELLFTRKERRDATDTEEKKEKERDLKEIKAMVQERMSITMAERTKKKK